MKKNLLLTASAVLSVSLLSAHLAQAKQTLKVWYFNTDFNDQATAFMKANPDVNVKITIVPQGNYYEKLISVIRTHSKTMPDVITLSDSWLGNTINKSFIVDLEKEYHLNSFAYQNFYPYLVHIGMDKKGHIRSLPIDGTIGAYFYKRSLAKKILGSADPKVVSEHIKDWDSYLKTAKLVKAKTHGKVKMLASADTLMMAMYYEGKNPLVVDNKINLEPLLNRFYNIYDQLNNEGNSANLKMWQPAMYKTYMNSSVFGYFLPGWAISLHLPKRAQGTEGDWGVARPPSQFTAGSGTFLSINKLSKKRQLALKYIKFATTNKKFLRQRMINTQSYSANKIINEEMANKITSPYIGGGQKPFVMLNKLSNELNIPTSRVNMYEQNFYPIILDKAVDYSAGAKSINKKDFLEKIKIYIHSNYHNLK